MKQEMANFQYRFLLALLFLFGFNFPLLHSIDFSATPKGFVFIPLGSGNEADGGKERYNTGGGGDVSLEIDLSTIWPTPIGLGYTAALEGGVILNEVKNDASATLSTNSFGLGLGVYFFPLQRLFTRIDGAIGVYLPVYDGNNGHTGLYLRGGAEAGFRFTPGFTLAANFGWRQFFSNNGVLNSGLYAGLSARITFHAGSGSFREGVSAVFEQYEPVYPVFLQLYQTTPAGKIVIHNNENAEIRNVRVSFRASPYTASEFPCGTVTIIPRGRSVDLPLLADFSPEILRFTDNGRILGEVVIRYNFLGQEREIVRAIIVSTHRRSAIPAADIAALAAFISPTSSLTLDYAKHIAGLARNSRRTGHNWNFQYAIWLMEALRVSGIGLGETYNDDTEVQFPAETLSYGTGSSRDLSLLFAAGLEGVGIPTGFIKTDEDLLAAFSLGINGSAAETLFYDTKKILVIDNEVWLPLSMVAFNDGFMAAWMLGVNELNEAFIRGSEVDFVMVEEAWFHYPPAPLPEQGRRNIYTNSEAAQREFDLAMQQYIEQELLPIVNRIQSDIRSDPSMALYNRLGIVLARSGRMAEAKTAYERSASMGSVPAMTNRANLALTEQDYVSAERFFRQALNMDSTNTAALRGLEQIEQRR